MVPLITAGVEAMLESGQLRESGRLQERGKVISWTMGMVTIIAMEQLELEMVLEEGPFVQVQAFLHSNG